MSTRSRATARRTGQKRYKYDKISVEKRRELVSLIIHDGKSVKVAAELLGIKYSTAKHIFHYYKVHGDACTPCMREKEEKDACPPTEPQTLDDYCLCDLVTPTIPDYAQIFPVSLMNLSLPIVLTNRIPSHRPTGSLH